MTLNRSWVLARRPEGAVAVSDFEYREEWFIAPELAEGEILVRSRIFSCAPTIRNWLNAPGRSYRGSIGIGQPIRGMAAVEVLASRHPRFSQGIRVTAVAPWQDHAVLRPDEAAVPVTAIPDGMDTADAMTLYSPNSLTAYFGLFSVGEPKPGQTVLVSGAAGSVGMMVCQMARIAGCRVVAVAGGMEKCRWLEQACGVARAIDYRSADVARQLKAACPEGIDIFFDNVGGRILQDAIDRMVPHGRIVLCGQISAYDAGRPAAGPADMMKLVYGRIRMEGFVVGDFADRHEEAMANIRAWAGSGRLSCRVDLREGFMKLPSAFADLFAGRNKGTLLVSNPEERL
ncbi:NADP-dependent oxidoreductase [Sphingobium sp.]|uniref:NADP-dependent oxidoreductase n=1 Tax=Sphingobium sp. TaxID=1912891 RepID=UPI0028BEBD63|nr:NADP-dependent oxidoreductase [Sphingobium sp.]